MTLPLLKLDQPLLVQHHPHGITGGEPPRKDRFGKPVHGVQPGRKGFIDKEADKESGYGNFGVRQYDYDLGKFVSTDPLWEAYRGWTPYQYSVNNPLVHLDPNGKWDVTVHIQEDREAVDFMGVAILYDNDGNEVMRIPVKLKGQHRDRMEKNGDTPYGTWDIVGDGGETKDDNSNTWRYDTQNNDKSFGPQHRLILSDYGTSGEAKECGRRDIRFHGGRQADGRSLEETQGTHGCVRASDEDMVRLKQATERIQAQDPTDLPGVFTVTNTSAHSKPYFINDRVPLPNSSYIER